MDKPRKPDWAYWLNLPHVEVTAACALSCQLEPRDMPRDGQAFAKYKRRCAWAIEAIRANALPSKVDMVTYDYYGVDAKERRLVMLAAFRAWGESLPKPLTFPSKFPKVAKPKPHEASNGESQTEPKPRTLRSDREHTMLLIIRALLDKARLTEHSETSIITRSLERQGFEVPKDADTMRGPILDALKLQPENPPTNT